MTEYHFYIQGYARVSADDLTTQNQIEAVECAGYEVNPSRVIDGVANGATPAMDRPQFVKLVDKLEEGNCLVVTKIDRLGRDNIDVQMTITMLLDMGVKLLCLDLPAKNLSKAKGKVLGRPIAKTPQRRYKSIKSGDYLNLRSPKFLD